MYAQWRFDIADCQSKHAPAQWDRFKVPTELLLEQPRRIHTSGILALPTELLLQISTHVDSVSQLFLALTCKRLLVVSTMTATMIPCAPKHRSDHLNCSAMLAILHHVRPLDARGRPKQSWAPCCVCYRYRPKRKSYWKHVQKLYPKGSASGLLDDYDYIVQRWSAKYSSSYQCPHCWCEERITKYPHLVK